MSVRKAGEAITLNEGAELTAAYRSAHPTERKGHLIGMDLINKILGQSGCEGIRIYHGQNRDAQRELVLVGVDTNGNDMHLGIIADRLSPCPNTCSSSNPLNG